MHPIIGLAMLIGVFVFVIFAFRQGTQVRRSGRSDDGAEAWPGDGSGSGSHHSDSGGFGHG